MIPVVLSDSSFRSEFVIGLSVAGGDVSSTSELLNEAQLRTLPAQLPSPPSHVSYRPPSQMPLFHLFHFVRSSKIEMVLLHEGIVKEEV